MVDKTIDDYRNRHVFSDAQLKQIALGLSTSINVDFYANPKISAYDMDVIRRGLLRGKDMTETKRLALPSKRRVSSVTVRQAQIMETLLVYGLFVAFVIAVSTEATIIYTFGPTPSSFVMAVMAGLIIASIYGLFGLVMGLVMELYFDVSAKLQARKRDRNK